MLALHLTLHTDHVATELWQTLVGCCYALVQHFLIWTYYARIFIPVAHKLVELGLIAQLLLGEVIMFTACRYHSHIYFT